MRKPITTKPLTPTERAVLADVRDGKVVHPTGPRKRAVERLMTDRLIRIRWVDDNTPERVITRAGLAALET